MISEWEGFIFLYRDNNSEISSDGFEFYVPNKIETTILRTVKAINYKTTLNRFILNPEAEPYTMRRDK